MASRKKGAKGARTAKAAKKPTIAKRVNAAKRGTAAKSRAALRAERAERWAAEIAERSRRNGLAGPRSSLGRLRKICLSFAGAHEVEAWGEPTFRVNNKTFAIHASPSSHHGGGRPAVWIYSAHVEQDLVIRGRPDRYFKPPYVGPSGWIGAWIDRNPPWTELAVLIEDAYERRQKGK